MERLILIVILLALNAAWWYDVSNKWENTSQDGVGGKVAIGIVMLIATVVILFNLGYILNS